MTVDRDIIIIGGGPAGLTAGLYAGRAMLNVLLLEKLSPGGQVLTTHWVENYPGFPGGVSGFDLMDKMKDQALEFGLTIQSGEVVSIQPGGPEQDYHRVVLTDGELTCRCLIITTGAQPRKLGLPNESAMVGKGVSYCGTCDGPFYRGMTVAAIGGGDTALEESLFLTKFVSKVFLIHRRDEFRGTKVLRDRVSRNDKIEAIWNTVVTAINGDDQVTGVALKNVKTNEASTLPVDGVFPLIGVQPISDFVKGVVKLDDGGFITTNESMETSVKGIFAAGDVRSKTLRQISTAVGDGAIAAFMAEKYMEQLH
ncbi:MAG: thioredoxin-disulfide reductase [Deltaproteobacteria bacterium]|nr:thioredoxin-disulfide reductase [Deltaproteobacteria bacterium]